MVSGLVMLLQQKRQEIRSIVLVVLTQRGLDAPLRQKIIKGVRTRIETREEKLADVLNAFKPWHRSFMDDDGVSYSEAYLNLDQGSPVYPPWEL